MFKLLINLSVLLLCVTAHAQYNWTWTALDTMPFRTSNNAVCEAYVNGNEFVYSFGGIDQSKSAAGIHQRSFKYSVGLNDWTEIDPLPDTLGKIAAAASYVKGKIYIIGGYHVLPNQSEISSNKVHVYNPNLDAFEADAANLPLAIDDHVQAVWRDSLIYVITGWSNTTNKPNVQIFNPFTNTWVSGTSTPNTGQYKAFGASGYILGDTIYYHGGVTSGFNFLAQSFVRKGVINAQNPTEILWEMQLDAPGAKGYRSAASGTGTTVFWVGGAGNGYNFDGIAYDGSGGVEPSARILHYNNWSTNYIDNTTEPYGVMDLRGIAKLSNDKWIICGGMDSSQVVSNRTFLLENSTLSTPSVNEETTFGFDRSGEVFFVRSNKHSVAQLYTMDGKVVKEFSSSNEFTIDLSIYANTVYLFRQGNSVLKLVK